MLPSGIVLMVLGALIAFVSFGGGLAGLGLGLQTGGWCFSLGFLLAIAGAIISAIHDHKKAVLAELQNQRRDIRNGFQSLRDELDRVRANTEPPAPIPVYGTAPINPGDGQLREP